MRKIWATTEAMPFSQETIDAASDAGASEIVSLPCPALPDLAPGYSEIVPPVSVPEKVTMRQARLALLQQGILSTVNAAVAAADEGTQIAWDYSKDVYLNEPMIAAIGAGLGLSDADIDAIFVLADTL